MDQQKQHKITIVNKNYPPNRGITGESANELAVWLQDNGFQVKIIHTDGGYAGGEKYTDPAGELIPVKSIYNGKRKLIRLFASFVESYRLIRKAKQKGEGLLIIMTDPPFLILWSALLLKKKKWAYWSMDIYPEAFAAGKLISHRNVLYRLYKNIMRKSPPHYIIALGELQLAFILRTYRVAVPNTILPCGIKKNGTNTTKVTTMPYWKNDNKIILGYCGNLGEAHSKNFLLAVLELLDANKYSLVLSVYGSKAGDVVSVAKNKPGVIITEHVQRNHLKYIDVHLVTLLPEWNHICVPSKAISAVCEGGVLLFCGNKENDNWSYLQKAAWFIEESDKMRSQIKKFLCELTNDEIQQKRIEADKLSLQMETIKQKAFACIAEFAQQ